MASVPAGEDGGGLRNAVPSATMLRGRPQQQVAPKQGECCDGCARRSVASVMTEPNTFMIGRWESMSNTPLRDVHASLSGQSTHVPKTVKISPVTWAAMPSTQNGRRLRHPPGGVVSAAKSLESR